MHLGPSTYARPEGQRRSFLVQAGGTYPDRWQTTQAVDHRHAAVWGAYMATRGLQPEAQAQPVRADVYVADASQWNRYENGAPRVVIQCQCEVGGPPVRS